MRERLPHEQLRLQGSEESLRHRIVVGVPYLPGFITMLQEFSVYILLPMLENTSKAHVNFVAERLRRATRASSNRRWAHNWFSNE